MSMLSERITRYMSQTHPQAWDELMPADRQEMIAAAEDVAMDLIANPPWPAPRTTDHSELVAYHQQVRSWAIETAMHSEIYEVWPTDPEVEEADVSEMTREAHALQQELIAEREAIFAALDGRDEE